MGHFLTNFFPFLSPLVCLYSQFFSGLSCWPCPFCFSSIYHFRELLSSWLVVSVQVTTCVTGTGVLISVPGHSLPFANWISITWASIRHVKQCVEKGCVGIKGLESFERKSPLGSQSGLCSPERLWLRRGFVIPVRPGCAWLLQHSPDQLNETTCHINLTNYCTTRYPSVG